MAESYEKFLEGKAYRSDSHGFEPIDLNPMLFPFQADIVRWACRKGRACVFADCGMGKGPIALEWASQVVKHSGGGVLIVAPLAVSNQFVREGRKFGVKVNKCKESSDVVDGINVTNYERLEKFEGMEFSGVALDESSILKNYSGKTRNKIIDMFRGVPFKLACTATPSPNDVMELANHSEWVESLDRKTMLATYFVHDGGMTSKWRLKGHAVDAFWDYVSTWAVTITKPSDLGYSDDGYKLPNLTIDKVVLESNNGFDDDRLFPVEATNLTDQRTARRNTLELKADYIAQMVNSDDAQWIVWTYLNAESAYLADAIPDSVEVRGSDSDDHKEDALTRFAEGDIRVLVTKPSIAGFGLNLQMCYQEAFCGLSHSWEEFYQSLHRVYRYGQTHPVEIKVVVSDQETAIVNNVLSKQEGNDVMQREMTRRSIRIKDEVSALTESGGAYITSDDSGEKWHAKLGDCVRRIKELDDNSIDYTIFSPPFSSLYTYSDSNSDLGNCRNDDEFAEHFGYLVPELYRVTKPGRLLSFHCMLLPAMKERDGYIGLKDFRGDLIRIFENAGWIFHSEVTIWKDPVTEMQRTKAIGLLNKRKNSDANLSRQGLPDYLVTMRKPGDNEVPIVHDNETFPISVWQKYASPVWMDINQSDTLQRESAREDKDEKHICPLQLEVIRRGVKLWTNPGELVLSPFMGIGSEGYVSVKEGRRFIGIELKPSYYAQAIKNLDTAEREASQRTLFDFLDAKGDGFD